MTAADSMTTWLALIRNELVQLAARAILPLVSKCYAVRMNYRVSRYYFDQRRLVLRYGISDLTRIHGYDQFTEQRISACAQELPDAQFATTSGTTGRPKKIVYTPQRLRKYRGDAMSCAVRAFHKYRIRRPSLFVLASHKADDSFSSLVLHDSAMPGYMAGLFEPARYLNSRAMLQCMDRYGASAVRLWLAVASNPGVLYATNPSTVAAFLADIHEHWAETTAMIRDFYHDADAFKDISRVLRRVATRRYRRRMRAVAQAFNPININEYWPSLSAWSSWDGGYVTPYLRQVKSFLTPAGFVHIPVFSMSTEGVETLTYFKDDGEICFLPVARDIVYEFVPEESGDDAHNIVSPSELEVGRRYAMVISDPYGLLRYQTEDVFECRGFVRGLPDLRFLHRRGISFSFTGEKVTGQQLTEVFKLLSKRAKWLEESNAQMCCFPCGRSGQLPYYRLAIVLPPGARVEKGREAEIVVEFEEILSAVNPEFSEKRRSGRLGESQLSVLEYDQLAAVLDRRTRAKKDVERRAWESQFKLSPLFLISWEDISNNLSEMGLCHAQERKSTG